MRRSRLSIYKQRLIELFIAGSTARTAASLVGVNTKTAAVYSFHRLRELIYQFDELVEKFTGEIEVDESYFCGRRKGRWTIKGPCIWPFKAQWQGFSGNDN